MTLRSAYLSAVLKTGTLILLGALLLFLGSATRQASLGAYLSFFGIILLQGVEVFFPVFSREAEQPGRRMLILRVSILLQLLLASLLVAFTDGSGSIYELVYLLPIVSAATKLPAREVAFVVVGAIVALVGFIVTGEQLTASIHRVKEFQDAVAAMVYMSMAGILVYLFAQAERVQRVHYQTMAATLTETNEELQRVQAELTERLTQLNQMEERIQQVGQMAALGELAAQVAHEVRTPLGIIKGATELLASRVQDPSTRRHISVLLEEVERLNKAVESILRLGTPLRINRASVNLSDLLRTVTPTSTTWSAAGPHRVQLILSPEPLTVTGDRELLHHALTNLVRNAFQAMPAGGTVTVTTRPSGDGSRAVVAVADTGVGLSAADLKRLGEPFFTKRAGGVGLGFALARRIVAEHGGTIEVNSTYGQGTVITIRLPVESREQAGSPSTSSRVAQGMT